jgi:pimeloyl-ACP methyl ester carboxylesterase
MLKRYRAFQQEGLANLVSQSQVVATRYGVTEYAVQGKGSAILVSHGSFGGFDLGLMSVHFLKDIRARFIVPSRFGYLRTPLRTDSTPNAQAHAFVALLDHLGIEQVWMLGLSAGGMSALEFALQFPQRCLGLIMISAVSTRPLKALPVRFMVEHVLTNEFLGWMLATYLPQLVAQSTGDNFAQVTGDPNLKKTFLNLAWPPFAKQRRVGMLNDLHQADHLPDYPFEKIQIPLLSIHSTADPFVPYDTAKNLADSVRGAQLLSLQKGGHLSFLAHHEQTRTAVINFIDAHSP